VVEAPPFDSFNDSYLEPALGPSYPFVQKNIARKFLNFSKCLHLQGNINTSQNAPEVFLLRLDVLFPPSNDDTFRKPEVVLILLLYQSLNH
jgi:hypothetical protein